MNFVQYFSSGNVTAKFVDSTPKSEIRLKSLEEIVRFIQPEVESVPVVKNLDELVDFSENPEHIIVASKITYNSALCRNLSKVGGSEKFLNSVYKVSAKSCVLDNMDTISENVRLTRGQALIMLMRFYGENPSTGISSFEDIPLGNLLLQGYAQRAYEKNIFKLPNLYPNKNLTRGEFIEILARFGKLNNANGKITYTDVSPSSTLYQNIQNFGATIGTSYKSFTPNTLITQGEAMDILAKLTK